MRLAVSFLALPPTHAFVRRWISWSSKLFGCAVPSKMREESELSLCHSDKRYSVHYSEREPNAVVKLPDSRTHFTVNKFYSRMPLHGRRDASVAYSCASNTRSPFSRVTLEVSEELSEGILSVILFNLILWIGIEVRSVSRRATHRHDGSWNLPTPRRTCGELSHSGPTAGCNTYLANSASQSMLRNHLCRLISSGPLRKQPTRFVKSALSRFRIRSFELLSKC